MENRVLRYFLVVAREENITRASEILHISQPALSRQLMQLEEELGAQLFIRGKRSITLTEEGRFLRHRAQEIIELTDKTERDFRDGIDTLSGTVAIGMGETSASEWIADAIREFTEGFPNVRFEIHSNTAPHIKEQIEKGLLDIGILLEPTDLAKYDYVRLPVLDRWGVVVPAKCPLSQKDKVAPADLEGRKLFVPKRAMPTIVEWLGDYYNERNTQLTYNLLYNIATLVDKGMGTAFTIDGAVALYHNPNIIFRPLFPAIELSSVFVWKKYQSISPSVLKFLDFIKMRVGYDK